MTQLFEGINSTIAKFCLFLIILAGITGIIFGISVKGEIRMVFIIVGVCLIFMAFCFKFMIERTNAMIREYERILKKRPRPKNSGLLVLTCAGRMLTPWVITTGLTIILFTYILAWIVAGLGYPVNIQVIYDYMNISSIIVALAALTEAGLSMIQAILKKNIEKAEDEEDDRYCEWYDKPVEGRETF